MQKVNAITCLDPRLRGAGGINPIPVLSQFFLFLFLGFLLLSATACRHRSATEEAEPLTVENLNRPDRVIGVPQGAVAMTVGEQVFEKAKIRYYHSVIEGYTAVQHGKLDAFVFDRHALEYIVKVNKDLALLPEELAEEHIVVGMPLHHTELRQDVDRFIEQYREDGTYQDMYARWFSENPPPMPKIPVPKNPTRRLKVGTEGLCEPMNFFSDDGTLTGFDLEFIHRLALFLNAEVEITTLKFDGLLLAAESGKIDLLVANLNASEESRKIMLFSKDYVDSAISVMVRKDRMENDASKTSGKISSIAQLNDPKFLIGGETGTIALREGENRLPKARFLQLKFPVDLYLALESKKVDAVVYDRPSLEYAALHRPNLVVLPEDICPTRIAAAAPFRNEKLVRRVNEFIKTYRENGTYDEMYRRWILEKNPVMPDLPEPVPTGSGSLETLVVGTDCQNEPMNFIGPDGRVTGFDIEFIKRLALFLNVKCEIKLMEYEALFSAAAAGKIDLAVANMDATKEREESMLFTDDYINNAVTVMIRKEDSAIDDSGISDFSQLYEKRIGVMSGTTADIVAHESFASSIPVYFNSFSEMVMALETGRVEGFLMDTVQSQTLLNEKKNLKRLPKELRPFDYAFVFSKEEAKRCKQFSERIRAMKRDGTLKKLEEKWFSGDESRQAMPTEALTDPPNGTLRMATVPQFEPMTFIRNGKVVGYDIEIAHLAAASLGYRLEPVIMEWSGYLESVASGKTHFGAGCTNVTEERKQKALFSEPTYRGGTVVIVKKSGQVDAGQAVRMHWIVRTIKGFEDSFDRTFLRENRWKLIVEGLKITVIITVFSAFFGTILAFGVCALRRSGNFWCRSFGKIFIALMQGMPILVVLMILYYVVFARVDIDAVLVAVIGFSLNFSVYVGEMIRAALDGIPKGQHEAAMALGFKPAAAFRKIIFPQMLRRILPVYRGEFINMLKMTSIVGYIAIQDLTKMSDIIRSRTYEAFFPLIATAVIYFIVAHLLASCLSLVEFRLDPKNRRQH